MNEIHRGRLPVSLTKRDRRPQLRAAIVILKGAKRPSVRNPIFGATAESGPEHRVAPDLGVLRFNRPRTGGGLSPSSR